MKLLFFFILMILVVFGWTYAAMHYRLLRRYILEKIFRISKAGRLKRVVLEGWESSPRRYALRIWGLYDMCFGIPVFLGFLYLAFVGFHALADFINITPILESIMSQVYSKK